MTSTSITQSEGLEAILDDEDAVFELAQPSAHAAADDLAEDVEPNSAATTPEEAGKRLDGAARRRGLQQFVVFVLLPMLALAAAGAAAYFRWYGETASASRAAGIEAVEAARDSTIAMLAYQPDNVEQNLHAAADRLTGNFRDVYGNLVGEVVIPGARDKKVTTQVTVPTASIIASTPSHAVVLVYLDQHVTLGADPPTDNATAVKLTLDKVGERWLVSGFDPI